MSMQENHSKENCSILKTQILNEFNQKNLFYFVRFYSWLLYIVYFKYFKIDYDYYNHLKVPFLDSLWDLHLRAYTFSWSMYNSLFLAILSLIITYYFMVSLIIWLKISLFSALTYLLLLYFVLFYYLLSPKIWDIYF